MGPAGLIDTSRGSPLLTPAGVLIRSICASWGGVAAVVQAPPWVAALALDASSKRTIWLANLTGRAGTVGIDPDDRSYDCLTLQVEPVAMTEPGWEQRPALPRSHRFRLLPWEVMRLEQR